MAVDLVALADSLVDSLAVLAGVAAAAVVAAVVVVSAAADLVAAGLNFHSYHLAFA